MSTIGTIARRVVYMRPTERGRRPRGTETDVTVIGLEEDMVLLVTAVMDVRRNEFEFDRWDQC